MGNDNVVHISLYHWFILPWWMGMSSLEIMLFGPVYLILLWLLRG